MFVLPPAQMAMQQEFPLHAIPNPHGLVMNWDFREGDFFPKSSQKKNVSCNKGKSKDAKGEKKSQTTGKKETTKHIKQPKLS